MPASLYDWARNLHEQGQTATHHNLLNHRCELDGDIAHTETYYLYVGRSREDISYLRPLVNRRKRRRPDF